MSFMFLDSNERSVQVVVCPKCGRKVRVDEDCDCETMFITHKKPK